MRERIRVESYQEKKGGEREVTEVIQKEDRVVGGGFEGSGGRWMPRGWHDFKRFAGGVNINLGK